VKVAAAVEAISTILCLVQTPRTARFSLFVTFVAFCSRLDCATLDLPSDSIHELILREFEQKIERK
jgi:hypothetical protein